MSLGGTDAAASAVIGIVLIAVAVVLAVETHSLIIGESAPADVAAGICREAQRDEAVARITPIATMHLGPDAVLIVVEAAFRPDLMTPDIESAVRRETPDPALRSGARRPAVQRLHRTPIGGVVHRRSWVQGGPSARRDRGTSLAAR